MKILAWLNAFCCGINLYRMAYLISENNLVWIVFFILFLLNGTVSAVILRFFLTENKK